ncbi:MAG: hypothetical protein ACI9QL_004207 [Candidatus Omnitrophota bacterium]|jgi:hypothetical protein
MCGVENRGLNARLWIIVCVLMGSGLIVGHAQAQLSNLFKGKKSAKVEAKDQKPQVVKAALTSAPAGQAHTAASKPSYKFHKVLNPEQAEDFVTLARQKQQATEQMKVLKTLKEEKLGELSSVAAMLKRDYDIQDEQQYDYDRDIKEVFLMEKEARTTSAHMMKDDGDEARFLRLLTAKKLTSGVIATFKLVLVEKERELKAVEDGLNTRFEIIASEDYFYQADSKTLFLVEKSSGL